MSDYISLHFNIEPRGTHKERENIQQSHSSH